MRTRAVPVVLGSLALAVVVLVALFLGARGAGGGSDDGLDFLDTPYYEVLYDDDATADDVARVAEAPDALVELDDGTEVRLYGIADQEGGDAQKAAVQVRRAGVAPVAHLVPAMLDLTAVGDHAVLHSLDGEVMTVDPDGALHEVTANRTDADGMIGLGGYLPAAGVEPGDVLVGNDQVVTLYRPSTREVHEVPLPDVDPDVVPEVQVVDGRVWLVDSGERQVTVQWSSDGERWSRTTYDLPSGQAPSAVAARGDALAILDSTTSDMTSEAATLRIVEDGRVRSIEVPDGVDDAFLGWSVGGDVLLGSEGTWFRTGGGGLERMEVPGRVWTMTVSGDDLVAFRAERAVDQRGRRWVLERPGGLRTRHATARTGPCSREAGPGRRTASRC